MPMKPTVGNTDDVSRADSGSKGSGERTELRHITLLRLVALDGKTNGCKQLTLWETQADGKKNVGAK